jgi:outer membrane lipoprotein carrier protein
MSRVLALLTVVAVLLGLSAPAQAETEPATVDELVAMVEARYGEVQALQADYQQKTTSMAGEVVSKGQVTLARPSLMKWDSTGAAAGSLFVTNGEKMWVYVPDDKQVLVYNDLSQAGGGVPMDLLGSIEKLDEHFDVQVLPSQGDRYAVKAAPKGDAASQYKEIQLVFGKADLQLQKVTMLDHFGTTTEFTFTGLTLNPTVDAASFTFVPPAGVEVVAVEGI